MWIMYVKNWAIHATFDAAVNLNFSLVACDGSKTTDVEGRTFVGYEICGTRTYVVRGTC